MVVPIQQISSDHQKSTITYGLYHFKSTQLCSNVTQIVETSTRLTRVLQTKFCHTIFKSVKAVLVHLLDQSYGVRQEKEELFNDVSFKWKARGWCSLLSYARNTDRQVDSYEDR